MHRGGDCRHVLAKTNPDVQADLDRAIAASNACIGMLSTMFATRLEVASETPLLHFVVDEHFQQTSVAFASPYVAQEVAKCIAKERRMELRRLISSSREYARDLAALRGLLFEQVAHSMLQHGGSFRFADLAAADVSAVETIQVDENLKVEIFRTLEEFTRMAAPGVYAQPAAKHLGSMDAVLIPFAATAPVMFLQMVAWDYQPIKAAALKKVRDALPPALKMRGVQVVFVVPEDVEDDFTRQSWNNEGRTAMQQLPNDVPRRLLTVRLAMQ